MSKIGKQPIQLPSGVSAIVEDGVVSITGPKGSLSVNRLAFVDVVLEDGALACTPNTQTNQAHMNWGTLRALLANAVEGVVNGFSKNLEIEGVGYKASVEGSDVVLKVGFSHLVNFPIPEGITVSVEKNVISISGIDKHLVGHVAARIRKIKKPEPYLGKGIRYQGEIVRRKAGKKAATSA